jgi:hypothetical protein
MLKKINALIEIPQHCSHCLSEMVIGHKAPTAESDGEWYYTCESCGKDYVKIDKHNMEDLPIEMRSIIQSMNDNILSKEEWESKLNSKQFKNTLYNYKK